MGTFARSSGRRFWVRRSAHVRTPGPLPCFDILESRALLATIPPGMASLLPTVSLAVNTPGPYAVGQPVTLTGSVVAGSFKELPRSYEFQVGPSASGPWTDLASPSAASSITVPSPQAGTLFFQVTAKVLVDTDAAQDLADHEPDDGYGDVVDLSAPGLNPYVEALTPAALMNDALLAFHAIAAPPAPPAVGIAINNTAQNSDDIALLDPPANPRFGLAFVQPIPARITLTNGPAGVYSLSVNPPGAVTLPASVTFQNPGQSQEILITPQKVSAAPNDVTITATSPAGAVVGTAHMTVVSVYFFRHIRNGDTPAAMPDRIPPRVNTPFAVAVTPNLAGSGQFVTLATADQVGGGGLPAARFGEVSIGGNATENITSSGIYSLSGVKQTAPTANAANLVETPARTFTTTQAATAADAGQVGGGNAGRLDLVVKVDGHNTVESLGFSVAAIPENMRLSLARTILAGPKRGFVVRVRFGSDSGNLADLNAVNMSEVVEYAGGRGTLANFAATVKNSGYQTAARTGMSVDTHTTRAAAIIPNGGFILGRQVFVFLDTRTGSVNVPMTNSGYVLTRDITLDPITRTYRLTMSKTGMNTSAKGFASDAGAIVGGPVSITKVP